VSEREDISTREDPADTTERRDWDVPSTAADLEHAGGSGGPGDDEPPDAARDRPDISTGGQPADETEKRDWDLP
jgi:hypothetical protein